MAALNELPLAGPLPDRALRRLTSVVAFVCRSRMKMSRAPLSSPSARLLALDSKTT
jgi:hypothetical protein